MPRQKKAQKPAEGPATVNAPPSAAADTPSPSAPPSLEATAQAEPATAEEGQPPKQWGDPYKAVFTAKDFEMGEDRRFKQRVFRFKDKPQEHMLAALKENGFTYRANEKAWTIQANAETRVLSDRLAHEFAGQEQAASR